MDCFAFSASSEPGEVWIKASLSDISASLNNLVNDAAVFGDMMGESNSCCAACAMTE